MQLCKLKWTYMSLHADPWAGMQIHELACSSLSLHAVPWTFMKFNELTWSAMSLRVVSWACMQFLFSSEQLTRISQCLLLLNRSPFIFGLERLPPIWCTSGPWAWHPWPPSWLHYSMIYNDFSVEDSFLIKVNQDIQFLIQSLIRTSKQTITRKVLHFYLHIMQLLTWKMLCLSLLPF